MNGMSLTALDLNSDLARQLAETFWPKVDKRGEQECWPWLGYIHVTGYGILSFRYVEERAHRLAYLLTHGVIPQSTPYVLHTCDVPRCCNPSHLYAGTLLQNSQDMRDRNRLQKGSSHHAAKICEDDVRMIRDLYDKHGLSHRAIGKLYSMSGINIRSIVRRYTWEHVE